MAINHFFLCLLIIVVITNGQKWIQYTNQADQLILIEKYLHRILDGYFVDCGENNPIHKSNTIKLSNWKGVIVEADPEKVDNIRDFEPTGVTALNFGLTNVSGTKANFYENNSKRKPIKGVMTINLADLCHKYYKAKPTLMNIDLEGLGTSVFQSNDWSNNKCIPDIIHSKNLDSKTPSDQANIENFFKNNNYILQQKGQKSNIFIHKTKLQFYQNEAKINSQYLKNVTMAANWQDFAAIISKLIGKPFLSQYIPSTNPAYFYLRQPSIINIVELNKYSNFISKTEPNRPLIILEYDNKISSIYLGTKNPSITQVTVNDLLFKRISSVSQGKELLIFILDHQKDNIFDIKLIEDVEQQDIINFKTNALIDIIESRKIKINDFILESSNNLETSIYYLLIFALFMTNIALFFLYFFYMNKSLKNIVPNTTRQPNKYNSMQNANKKI